MEVPSTAHNTRK